MSGSKISFTITGDFLTSMSRNWVLEERWDDSVKWLKDSLEGIRYDDIVDILSGKFRLTGNSKIGIDLEEEEAIVKAKYEKGCKFLYEGIYKESEKYYRPYAVVTDYGQADLFKGEADYWNRGKRIIKGREKFYMRSIKDISFILKYRDKNYNILWELVDKPPFWLTTHQEPQKALDEYLEHHHNLEVTGYSTWYPPENTSNKSKSNVPKKVSVKTTFKKEILKEKASEEKIFEEKIKEIKEQVLEHSTSSLDLKVDDVIYKVPKEPFICWALLRTSGAYLAPKWHPFSPSGLKMYGDDSYHTDWLIGAGISLDDYPNKALDDAAYDLLYDIQNQILKFRAAAVLNGEGSTNGTVYQPLKNEKVQEGLILVIPCASPDYFIPMQTACAKGRGGVITQTGGKLCHLAGEARNLGVKMLLVPDALTRFPSDTKIWIDCTNGKVEIKKF